MPDAWTRVKCRTFRRYAYGPAETGDKASRRAFVLYPSSSASRSDVRVRSADGVVSARITALGIDLVRLLEAMERRETSAVPALDEIREVLALAEAVP
jgi:hypothetical protein